MNRIYTIDKECMSSFKTRENFYLELSELTLIELICTFTRKLIVILLARAPLFYFLMPREPNFAVISNHFSKLFHIKHVRSTIVSKNSCILLKKSLRVVQVRGDQEEVVHQSNQTPAGGKGKLHSNV